MCILLILYLIVGVIVASNYMARGVLQIISPTEMKTMFSSDNNKAVVIEIPTWSPTATCCFMTCLSLAPFGILHFVEVIRNVEFKTDKGLTKVSPIGHMAVIGASAFNLCFITAIAICSAGKAKKISDVTVWIYGAIGNILIVVWYILVIMVISPNVIEVWEACVAFLLFFVFTLGEVFINFCKRFKNRKNQYKEDEEEDYKIKAAKCGLRQISACYGQVNVIRAAKGEWPIEMKQSVV